MISYHNPGLIPLDAVRLMGASVKLEGSFGRFGTGFKYALATILRGGGSLIIWRGQERIDFETIVVEMKGQTFDEVVMVSDGGATRERLGFTTQLGRDWEPWMAHRELACNARDEEGSWAYISAEDLEGVTFGHPEDVGETAILVDWPEMDKDVLEGGAGVFAPEGEPLAEERGVRVLAGPSDYLYHRGVRVWKLPKPSVFTYDIVREVELTEDRTVKYGFCVVADVRNMLLASSDRTVIDAAVSADKDHWEGSFDWAGTEWAKTEPGHVWLEVVAEGRETGQATSASAKDVLLKHRAFKQVTRSSWEDVTGVNEALSDAAEALEEMGFDLEKVEVYIVDELPGQALSSVRNKSVYLSRQLLSFRRNLIVRELLTRFLEREGGGDHDTLLKEVAGRFFNIAQERVYWLRRDEALHTEEVKQGLAEPLAPEMDF